VGLLRFCVVFLLGLGAALGAYATGTLDYMSRQHYFRSWYQPGSVSEHDMVLRVSGNALNGACTARYAVDNRSGRRVFVVFAPQAGGPTDARFASDDRQDARQEPYGSGGPVDARYASGAYGSYADAREEFRPGDGPDRGSDPYRNAGPRDAQGPEALADNEAPPPIEVGPGERKILGRTGDVQVAQDDGSYGSGDDAPAAPCGDDHVVKLQIADCADGDGGCVAAMNSPGGANP
jgi:hypothetical protein